MRGAISPASRLHLARISPVARRYLEVCASRASASRASASEHLLRHTSRPQIKLQLLSAAPPKLVWQELVRQQRNKSGILGHRMVKADSPSRVESRPRRSSLRIVDSRNFFVGQEVEVWTGAGPPNEQLKVRSLRANNGAAAFVGWEAATVAKVKVRGNQCTVSVDFADETRGRENEVPFASVRPRQIPAFDAPAFAMASAKKREGAAEAKGEAKTDGAVEAGTGVAERGVYLSQLCVDDKARVLTQRSVVVESGISSNTGAPVVPMCSVAVTAQDPGDSGKGSVVTVVMRQPLITHHRAMHRIEQITVRTMYLVRFDLAAMVAASAFAVSLACFVSELLDSGFRGSRSAGHSLVPVKLVCQ